MSEKTLLLSEDEIMTLEGLFMDMEFYGASAEISDDHTVLAVCFPPNSQHSDYVIKLK